jgi:hypothetical protein
LNLNDEDMSAQRSCVFSLPSHCIIGADFAEQYLLYCNRSKLLHVIKSLEPTAEAKARQAAAAAAKTQASLSKMEEATAKRLVRERVAAAIQAAKSRLTPSQQRLMISADTFSEGMMYATKVQEVADKVQALALRIDHSLNLGVVSDFHGKEAEITSMAREAAHVADVSEHVGAVRELNSARHLKIRKIAREKQAVHQSSFKKSAKVSAAELKRNDLAIKMDRTSSKIDDLRLQLQRAEEDLQLIHKQLLEEEACLAKHLRDDSERFQSEQTGIAEEQDAAIAAADAFCEGTVTQLNALASQAAESEALLTKSILEIRAERSHWQRAVCMKAASEVTQLDVRRLFKELAIRVDDDEAIARNSIDGEVLTSEDLNEDDLMEALSLQSLKDKLLIRHLRQAVAARTLAFTLADVDADNALTWDEGQVLAWLRRYRGRDSLVFLEEACQREHLNGIAMLQVDKSVLKYNFGVTQLGTLSSVLKYISEIRISPGPLSQLLLLPVLTISRSIEPPAAIRLHSVDLGSPFAACVLQRKRCDNPSFRISRVSRVSVDKSREEAFCSMINRECSSRQANPKLRPSNFTDAASVAGLKALTQCFETNSNGEGSSCNVVFAWHGPPPEHVESVCRDNPRSFRTTDGGFFGAGLYFALELDYAARYAMMRPPSPSGEYGVILFAVMVSSAYVVTPARDYPADDPQQPTRSGFSRFYNPDPQSSISLMPGYSSHFVPVKYCGQLHSVSGVQLPHDTDYQAVVEQQSSAWLLRAPKLFCVKLITAAAH